MTEIDPLDAPAASRYLDRVPEELHDDYRRALDDGATPLSAAAAISYIVSRVLDEGRTQSQVAEEYGVSEGTIRQWYQHIVEYDHGDVDWDRIRKRRE